MSIWNIQYFMKCAEFVLSKISSFLSKILAKKMFTRAFEAFSFVRSAKQYVVYNDSLPAAQFIHIVS